MALTKVILDGPLGKRFGKEWDLAVSTPAQALQIIQANDPGFSSWMKSNASKYANYRVTVVDKSGKKVALNDDTFGLQRAQPAIIRFTPITRGASAGARIVVGVILMISAIWLGPAAFSMGASLALGGLIELLSPRPKSDDGSSDDGTSYYFNGPVNTSAQGIPVPLIFGRCLVGSQSVSASISIDQLMG
jgi:predicted phage tail protein